MLLLGALVISLAAGDLAFRLYERKFLVSTLGEWDTEIDLASLNYNDSSVPVKKRKGEYRVLSFGDSFAFGITKYPYSYHGVGARMLNKALEDGFVRIVNLGEPTTSFYHYVEAHRYWSQRLEHDAVIFNVFLGNDIKDISPGFLSGDRGTGGTLKPYEGELPTIRKPLVSIPRKYPLRMLDYFHAYYFTLTRDTSREALDIEGRYLLPLGMNDADFVCNIQKSQLINFDPRETGLLASGYEGLARLVTEMSEIRRSGKPVLLVLSPNQFQVVPTMRRKLKKRYGVDLHRHDVDLPIFLAQQTVRRIDPDIPVMNLAPSFRCAAGAGRVLYYPGNTHWSVAGNHLVGEHLARFIGSAWLNVGTDELRSSDDCVVNQSLLGDVVVATDLRRSIMKQHLEPFVGAVRGESSLTWKRYSVFLDRRVLEFEVGGKVDITLELDGGQEFSFALDPDSGTGPINITGRGAGFRRREHPPMLGIAVNGTIAALARVSITKGTRGKFSFEVPRAVFRSGLNELEVLVVSRDFGRPRLYRTATTPKQGYALSRERETGRLFIISPHEGTITVFPHVVQGLVESSGVFGGYAEFTGWAVDTSGGKTKVKGILVFVNGKLAYYGWTGADHLGAEKFYGVRGAGFRYRIALTFLPGIADKEIRIFALSNTGIASELRYYSGYKWKKNRFEVFDIRNPSLSVEVESWSP